MPAVVWLLLGDCGWALRSARGGAGRGIVCRGGGKGGGVSGSPSSVMIMLAWDTLFRAGSGGGAGAAVAPASEGAEVDVGRDELTVCWVESGLGGGIGAALDGTLVRITDWGLPGLWKDIIYAFKICNLTQSKSKTQITRNVHNKFNCITVNYTNTFNFFYYKTITIVYSWE